MEKIAINAVMAGCSPRYLPVIVTAVQAMAEEQFLLTPVQTTTHPCGVFILVNGPMVKELGINGGSGAFGPGWVSNATIGRALRLILLNIGGAAPGTVDRSCQGQPCKYTFCVAENETDNPWQPYHQELNYGKDVSTVTVTAAEGPHNINDHVSSTAQGVLSTICQTMATMGSNNANTRHTDVFLVLGPEHASIIARDGLSKDDVKHYLYEHARIPLGKLKLGGMWGMPRYQPKWLSSVDDQALMPIVEKAEDFKIIVVGGAGRHSSWLPSFLVNRAVTRPITLKDGTPVSSVDQFTSNKG